MNTETFVKNSIDHILTDNFSKKAKETLLSRKEQIDEAIKNGCYLEMLASGSIALRRDEDVDFVGDFNWTDEDYAIVFDIDED